MLSGYVDGDGQREDCSFQLLDGGDKLGKRRRQRDRYENGWAGEEPGPHDGCKMNGGESKLAASLCGLLELKCLMKLMKRTFCCLVDERNGENRKTRGDSGIGETGTNELDSIPPTAPPTDGRRLADADGA